MSQPSTNQDLARAEKDTASTVEMGARRWVLAACVVAYLIALFLPFAGGASGWQVVGSTAAAEQAQTTLTEYLFAWFSLAGLGILTTLAVALRRFPLTVMAWAVTTVSLVLSVLGIWLRNSGGIDINRGAGYYLAMLAVAVAVFTIFPVFLNRSDEHLSVARQRAAAQETDAIANAQRSASAAHENPLLVDDRRARAAERHRR